MILLKKYDLGLITEPELLVGIPTKGWEKEEMFKIRKAEYLRRGYTSLHYHGGSDIDESDDTCEYFIAMYAGAVIGTVRLIRDRFLPIETECFRFDPPQAIKKIPREKRGEISRLVVSREKKREAGLPEQLVMFALFDSMARFGEISDIEGGYAIVKRSLHRIFRSFNFPIHVIEPYELIYTGKLMRGYLEDKFNYAMPIYFLREEVGPALKPILASLGVRKIEGRPIETLIFPPGALDKLSAKAGRSK